MKARVINQFTRKEIQRKYIDQILGELDFMQIKDRLRDYLQKEKDKESNYSLESEIRKEAPEILVDNWEDFSGPATLTQEYEHHA
jgi:dsRNA-specific ribonuclease